MKRWQDKSLSKYPTSSTLLRQCTMNEKLQHINIYLGNVGVISFVMGTVETLVD